jgi:alpha-beta hydrolase superfamily lysophospholipase
MRTLRRTPEETEWPAGTPRPRLKFLTRDERVTNVVLLIHGGQATSRDPVQRGSLPLARMRLFVPAILGGARGRGTAVALLRNRYRGWNEPDGDAVADAQWALAQVEQRYGAVPIALVGHSMGGRAALRIAGRPAVRAVAALAPWLPAGEAVAQLAERAVLVAHGDRDKVTSCAASLAYARRAVPVAERVYFQRIDGARHAMLEQAGYWHRLVRDFTLSALGVKPQTQELADALLAGSPESSLPGSQA